MKRLIKWIFFLVLLLIVTALAASFLIPIDSVKKMASERVKAMTGRDLVIAGEVKATFWPNIGVKLEKVTLSNPEGFSDKHMAEIESLNVEIELMPLLHGELLIKKFVIENPIINLEINKKNVPNWQFTKQESKDGSSTNTTSATTKKTSAAIIVLGKTKIKDGNISYKDMLTGKSYNAKNVNLDIQMPSIDSSLNIDAELTLNNEHASFSLHADQPLQLMEDGSSKITTNINIGSLLTLEFAGNATMQNANGNIDINIPSLIALSNWTGKKLDWNGDTSLALDIKGIISCTISDCSFNKAKIILDDNVLSGNMKINFANKIPVIEAKLTTDRFDINPYLAKNVKQASNSLSIISSAQAAQTQGWDTTPINLSGLRSINANLSLNAKELLYKNTILSKMALNLKLSNGSLALDIPYIELYDGTAKISATANASNAISATFNASKIQIEPLLKDFTQSDRLTGLANMNISITGNGASQRDIVSSLAGKGDVKINDGMFKGVDIAKVISTARDMVTGSDTYSEETKFSELGGTFTIAQGIIKNDDLMMKAPLLRLKGAGTVDLPRRYVNYRLIPSVVATLQGQGGKSKNGLDIPVIVEGSFEKLKFTPDLGSIIEETLKDPQKIKDTVKDIKDSVKKSGGLKNLLKGFK